MYSSISLFDRGDFFLAQPANLRQRADRDRFFQIVQADDVEIFPEHMNCFRPQSLDVHQRHQSRRHRCGHLFIHRAFAAVDIFFDNLLRRLADALDFAELIFFDAFFEIDIEIADDATDFLKRDDLENIVAAQFHQCGEIEK